MDIEHFMTQFSALEDPRKQNHNLRHSLKDILVLTILAVLCGAESWTDVEAFGEAKIDYLKTFLELPHGIPSHDTLGNFFARLDAPLFQSCFIRWIQSAVTMAEGEIVPLDGKTLRRSHDKGQSKEAIHLVSAWANSQGIVLGQRKVDAASNEIKAVPELLKVLDVAGCVVTADAMHCQKGIAQLIHTKKADYVLAVKKNQGRLYQRLDKLFKTAQALNYQAMVYSNQETIDKGHGRIEQRHYTALHYMYFFELTKQWPHLKSVLQVKSKRLMKDKVQEETRYYISSLPADAGRLGDAVRRHWSIENNLHWSLDVAFAEDACRVRIGNAPENFAIIRRIALNLLKQEKTAKVGIKIKRNKCGWDHRYLARVFSSLMVQTNPELLSTI